MTTSIILWTYRATATLLATSPIVLNVLFNQDIITSLLYVPLASLTLVGLTMVIDSALVNVFQTQRNKVVLKNKITVNTLPIIAKKVCKEFHRAA